MRTGVYSRIFSSGETGRIETRRPPSEQGTAQDWPAGLYERARRRLLENEPLLDATDGGPAAAALSSGEVVALESVGLSTAPLKGGAAEDALERSIADYMALIDTSHTT